MKTMSWNLFAAGCQMIKVSIDKKSINIKNIYGIPRGGLVVAVQLSHLLNIPLTNKPNPNDTLIVDDICDSGKTLEKYKDYNTATLYYNLEAIVKPDFWAFVQDDFIKFPWETEETAKVDYLEKMKGN